MNRTRQAGYTFIELAITLGVMGVLLAAFGRAFVSATSLGAESSARSLAAEDCRQDLLAIASELRSAAYGTLVGFSTGTTTSTLTFQCAAGADAAGATMGPAATLQWQAVSRSVDGVPQPGRVVLVRGTTTTVLAPRVPSGGFVLTRQGTLLRIQLSTYASTSARRVAIESRETTVFLRN